MAAQAFGGVLPRDLPRARSASRSAPTTKAPRPQWPHRRRSSRGRAVEHVLGIWVQADEGASLTGAACAPNCPTGAWRGAPDRRGGTSRLGAERAGECDGLTGLPEATRGHLAPVRGPDLRGYHLIRSSMRFVPYKGPRGGPPLLPGAPAPRWARRRPLGPWRTSPSPTPGPLPPDGGDVGEGPGRSTPFLDFPPTGRRVVPPPLAREVPPPPTLLSP